MLQQLRNQVEKILGSEFEVTYKIPQDQKAWLSVPVFAVAKKRGLNPQEIARQVADRLAIVENIELEITGGYVNIVPSEEFLKAALDQDFLGQKEDKGTVIVEFSSPNIAKPMSIGHLRSTIIGDALQRIYRYLGHKVISINYLGDWGTQFGKLLVAYKRKFGDLEPRDLSSHELLDLYVDFHKKASEVDNQAAREMFSLLEVGDNKATVLWQHLKNVSLKEFNKIYDELDIHFTEQDQSEARAGKLSDEIIKIAKEKGVAKESDGALIIPFDNIETPLILQKQDGSTIYGTRDLAALKFRLDTYKPEKILYVVGSEQILHLEQVFAGAHLLGFDNSTHLEHIKFGYIRLPEGKMSTRSGRVVFLTDVIEEAKTRAKEAIAQKSSDLNEIEKENLVNSLAIGALKYFDLKHSRQGDIVFNWDEMLSLKGKSAPYLQYSYVRAKSVLEKVDSFKSPNIIKEDEDKSLLRTLSLFNVIVEESAAQNAPHILANYLNELAEKFHWFYENYRILVDDEDSKNYRLTVTSLVSKAIKKGLDLLGIKTVEKM